MKKIKKILILLLILLFLILILKTTVNATDLGYYKPTPAEDPTELKQKAGTVLGAIQLVGSIISVISLAIIGIKYMMGSVEEKAEYKKTMLPYIIGAILVFASSNLVSILYQIGNDINNT